MDVPPLPAPSARSPETEAFLPALADDLFPFEADFVGPTTVADVARGATFVDPSGGRQLDASAAIHTLSALATLVHFCVLLTTWARKKITEETGQRTTAQTVLLVQEVALDRLSELQSRPGGGEIDDEVVRSVAEAVAGRQPDGPPRE